MATASDATPLRWHLSTPIIWLLGIPHFMPLLGVYALLGGKEHAFPLMAGALAVTGCIAGLFQSFSAGPRALLITPVSFFLGYAPAPYLIFGKSADARVSFHTAMLITLLTSTLCIMAGQWLLSRSNDR